MQWIAKWKKKRNQNVKNIEAKECNDKLRITTITRGKRTRTDVAEQGK
jgi:hypothetical protein